MDTKGTLRVKGYQFLTEDDADKARLDARKIDYLKSHTTGMGEVTALSAVYQKAIDNKIFTTPVGWSYLYGLREKMLELGTPENSITPIPVKIPMSITATTPQVQPISMPAPVQVEKKRIAPVHLVSYIANGILVLLVVVMFIVAYLGETNNVLNYKRNITNQYASWEEQLKEREAAVREKESELGIRPGVEATNQ